MNKTLAKLVLPLALILPLTLVGCTPTNTTDSTDNTAPHSKTEPQPAPDPEPAPAPDDSAAQDQKFLSTLKDYPIAQDHPEAAIRLGHSVCTALDGGESVKQVLIDLAKASDKSGATQAQSETVGAIMASAIYTYCPKYTDELGTVLDELRDSQTS